MHPLFTFPWEALPGPSDNTTVLVTNTQAHHLASRLPHPCCLVCPDGVPVCSAAPTFPTNDIEPDIKALPQGLSRAQQGRGHVSRHKHMCTHTHMSQHKVIFNFHPVVKETHKGCWFPQEGKAGRSRGRAPAGEGQGAPAWCGVSLDLPQLLMSISAALCPAVSPYLIPIFPC